MPIVTPITNETKTNETPIQTVPEINQEKESTPQENAPVQKPEETLSPQFAAIAKKEKMLREQARKIENEKRALKEREESIANSIHSEWKNKLSQNPWDTLIQAGLTPEQVTQAMLNQPKPEELEMRKLREELNALKSNQEKSLEEIKNQKTQSYEQAKKQIGMNVSMLIESDPDKYEALNQYGSYGRSEVVNFIEHVFNHGIKGPNGEYIKDKKYSYQPGLLMDIEDAAEEVENALVDQFSKLAKLKKVQSKLGVISQNEVMKQPISQKQPMNTLSNRTTPSTRPLTDKERKQRAILAFQGKL